MRLLIPAVLAAALLAPAPALGWSWPVNGPVLTLFSFDRDHPYAAGQHRGIDIGAPSGTAVSSPVSGTVSFAGSVPVSGKTVSIETEDGYSVTLVHLGSYTVRRGQAVGEGDVVGAVGPSGVPELAQPYVYLGVRLAADPQGYVDPLAYLPGTQPGPPQPPPDPGGEPAPPPDGDPGPPGVVPPPAPAETPAPPLDTAASRHGATRGLAVPAPARLAGPVRARPSRSLRARSPAARAVLPSRSRRAAV